MKRILKTTKMFAVLCMMFGMIFCMSNAMEAKAVEDISVEPRIYDGTIPTSEDALFAGWFTDAECTTAVTNKTNGAEYYAKFVPQEVLSVKVQAANTTDDYRDLRFVSSVDSLDYQEVGFALVVGDGIPQGTTSKTVYERIAAADSTQSFSFSPKVMDTKSEYFITALYDNSSVVYTDATTTIYARAYWKTLDGTTVYGPGRCVTMAGLLNQNTLLLPIEDANSALAVGDTVTLTYGTDNTEVTGTVLYVDQDTNYAYDNGFDYDYAYLSVALGDVSKYDLDSVTIFNSETLVTSAENRNFGKAYTGVGDTSWYDAYDEDKDEFVIATAADLHGLGLIVDATENAETFANKQVYIVNDITLNNMTVAEMQTAAADEDETNDPYLWAPIGATNAFAGTFDGQGHTISGVYYTTALADMPVNINTHTYHGFFSTTAQNSMVQDFRLTASLFEETCSAEIVNNKSNNNVATRAMGSVVGNLLGSMDSVYSSATVQCVFGNAAGLVGITGLIVDEENSTDDAAAYIDTSAYEINVTNCWFDGSVALDRAGNSYNYENIAGFIAKPYKGTVTVENCLNTGLISANYTGIPNAAIKSIAGMTGCNTSNLTLKDSVTAHTFSFTKNGTQVTTSGGTGYGGVVYYIGRCNATEKLINCYALKQSYVAGACSGTIDTQENVISTLTSATLTGSAAYNSTYIYDEEETAYKGLSYYSPTYNPTGTWVTRESAYPVPAVFEDDWSDTILDAAWYYNTNYYETDGSNNVYTINTAEEFYTFTEIAQTDTFAGDTILLAQDIVLNEGDASKWSDSTTGLRSWTPIAGDDDAAFAGTFDGQGHTISGCYMKILSGSIQRTGLFKRVENATLRNFSLINSYMKSQYNAVGSIAGRVVSSTVENIYSDARVLTSSGASRVSMGGMIAQLESGVCTINNLWFDGSVYSKYFAGTGGIIGTMGTGITGSTISNCLNTGTIKTESTSGTIGGLFGRTTTVTISNCLNAGEVTCTVSDVKGALIGSSPYTTSDVSYYATLSNCYALDGTCTVTDEDEVTTSVLVNGTNTIDETVFASATNVGWFDDAAKAALLATGSWKTVDGLDYPVPTLAD